jgi:hypothetical protein
MTRKRLTVKELYEKMEEIHTALISPKPTQSSWWKVAYWVGLIVGFALGYFVRMFQ